MSDTQSAPCGVGGFGFVTISIDHPKIPDELRGDVARLLDRLGIANAYIDALEARVAELEADSKRLDWLLRRGVAWRGCYNEWWSEGEWLYEKGKPRDIIDEAMEAKP